MKATRSRPAKPATGGTKPRQFRLTDAELARIDALARRWGPVKALTRTDVLREALDRAYHAEFETT